LAPTPPLAASRPFAWIETPEDLARAMESLRPEHVIGVDLEADSMFHFQESICLIQVAIPKQVFLIDPVGLPDLTPMAPLFASFDAIKVFHGSDYDLRSLDRDYSIRVNGLFDTQVAARFLGMDETGLASLLKTRFNVLAEKKYQKKDWSVRPLPAEMLSYAAEDAAYLIPLYRMLREELRGLGRLSWVEEECEILSRVRCNPPNDGPLFTRLRGAGSLDSRGLAVAEEILHLRLRVARRRNRPPFKVLGNAAILEMAQRRPTTMEGLSSIHGVSRGQVRSLGPDLLKALQQAMALPEEVLPVYPRTRTHRIDPEVTRRVRELKAWRDKRAAGLRLDPSILFTNAQLHTIAATRPSRAEEMASLSGIRRWQQNEFGEEICRFMAR